MVLVEYILQVKLESGPEPTGPVHTRRKRHRTRDTQTCSTRADIARQCKKRSDQHSKAAQKIKVQHQPAIGHPKIIPHLRHVS